LTDITQISLETITYPLSDVANFNATNEFLSCWSDDDYDIHGRFFYLSNQYPLEIIITPVNNEITFATSTNNTLHFPQIATFQDRFIISWLEEKNANETRVRAKVYSLDDEVPTIQQPNLGNHAILWDDIEVELNLGTIVEDEGAHIDAGLDTVYFHEHWNWRIGGLGGLGGGISAKTSPYAYNVFLDEIPKFDLRRATTLRYYVEAVDRAFNRSIDIPDPDPEFWHYYYISRRGDLDLDGYISDNDAWLLCLWLENMGSLEPWQLFFADGNEDESVDWDDYTWILNNLEEPYSDRAAIPLPEIDDEIEMGVGHGASGTQDNIVPVYITNDSTYLRGATYNIEYDDNILSLDQKMTTERTIDFSVASPCDQPETHIAVHGGESHSISPGEGPAIELSFSVDSEATEGSYHITLTRGDLADTLGVAVPHLKMRGKFFVGDLPPVSIVCSPLSDTSLVRSDTLTFNTVLTNHSWQGPAIGVVMYGIVTPQGMNPFLVVDTTYVPIAIGERVATLTEIEVPQNAPLVRYEFTGYACGVDTTLDEDTFGFHVTDTLGMVGGGGLVLSSEMGSWELLSGWFGSSKNQEETVQSPESSILPKVFSLSQNYPNPFNPMTTINYSIPEGTLSNEINLVIFNLRGQIIKRENLLNNNGPGTYNYTWDGRNDSGARVPSGVYFYQLTHSGKSHTKKMILLK